MSRGVCKAILWGVLLAPHNAHAFNILKECLGDAQTWQDPPLAIAIADISFPAGTEREEVENAVAEWDDDVIGKSDLDVISHVDTVTTTFDGNDGVNLIGFSGHKKVEGGTLGWAHVRGESCLNFNEILEVDIHLNDEVFFLGDATYYDMCDQAEHDDVYALGDTVRHEVGHGLGLGHVGYDNDGYPAWAPGSHLAVMFPEYSGAAIAGEDTYIDERPFVVSEDDRVGFRALYPDTTADSVADVAVQSYFYDDDAIFSDECFRLSRPSPAANDLTQIAIDLGGEPGDCPLSFYLYNCVTVIDEPVALQVVVDDVVEPLFTFLNLGTDTVDVDVRFLLTTEDDSTPATFLVPNEFGLTLAPGLPFEWTEPIEVPWIEDGGIWYIVAQVDPDDLIVESDEDNNSVIWNQWLLYMAPLPGCTYVGRDVVPGGSGFAGVCLGLVIIAGTMRRRRRVYFSVAT